MNRTIFSAVALLASTSFAFAQGQAPVADWSGAYAGFSVSALSGTNSATLPAGTVFNFDWDDATALGGFTGYNWHNGTMVYGVELGVTVPTSDTMLEGAATDDDFIHSLTDLRGRVGYAMGDVLFYGAAGLSLLDVTFNTTEDEYFLGYNVGVGVDYLMSDSLVLGIDYTYRDMDGEITDPANPFESGNTFSTLTLRAAYRF